MLWKQNEIDCLRNEFPKMHDNQLAKIIGKSPNALRIKASRLGIKKEMTHIREDLKLNHVEEQLVVGGLLGDLHCRIAKTTKYPRLQGAHGKKQRDYMLWKVNLMKRLRFRIRETKINTFWCESKSFRALTSYHNLFYGNGKKQVTKEILNLLNSFGLLIWYLDDGSYHKRDKNINLYTNGFSYKEHEVIQNWFHERYGFNPKIYSARDPKNYPGKVWNFIHFNAKDTKDFLNIFKEFEIPDCMKYKLGTN